MDKELIEIMCCIKCQGSLKLVDSYLVCKDCGYKYLIKDDIPIMLEENFRV